MSMSMRTNNNNNDTRSNSINIITILYSLYYYLDNNNPNNLSNKTIENIDFDQPIQHNNIHASVIIIIINVHVRILAHTQHIRIGLIQSMIGPIPISIYLCTYIHTHVLKN